MKNLIYIPLLFILINCKNKGDKDSNFSNIIQFNVDSTLDDSILRIKYSIGVTKREIKNKSDRKIDLLFNGVENFLGGQRNDLVRFRTECLACESVHEFRNGLLFAKRLLITQEEIKYYKTDFEIPDSIRRINFLASGRKRNNSKFSFEGGKGSISDIGVSCNDADFNKVRLSFKTGNIIIDSMINVSVFEYDLDSDGLKEQYLIGARSCNQELVILRIKKHND